MEFVQSLLDFAKRFFTVEILIMVILLIGTFVIFSFFVQDLLRDYFRDFQEKKKKDLEAGISSEKKPKPRKPKIKSRPRVVKKPKEPERSKGKRRTGTTETSGTQKRDNQPRKLPTKRPTD